MRPGAIAQSAQIVDRGGGKTVYLPHRGASRDEELGGPGWGNRPPTIHRARTPAHDVVFDRRRSGSSRGRLKHESVTGDHDTPRTPALERLRQAPSLASGAARLPRRGRRSRVVARAAAPSNSRVFNLSAT